MNTKDKYIPVRVTKSGTKQECEGCVIARDTPECDAIPAFACSQVIFKRNPDYIPVKQIDIPEEYFCKDPCYHAIPVACNGTPVFVCGRRKKCKL